MKWNQKLTEMLELAEKDIKTVTTFKSMNTEDKKDLNLTFRGKNYISNEKHTTWH